MENINWPVGLSFKDVERQVYLQALTHFNNNKSAAARSLGVTTRTIRNAIERFPELEIFRRDPTPRKVRDAQDIQEEIG